MTYNINQGTKTHKLFTAMIAGEKISPAGAQHRFGIQNIRAEASRIRQAGFAVYANSRKAGNGVQVTEYEIGAPTRELIAAGFRALSRGI